jgi:homoserine kinase
MDKKIIIRVPATSTGLGTGIDSIGIAFNLYYTVIVEESMNHWQVNHDLGPDIPHDEQNIIVKTIKRINDQVEPHQLTVMSDIPIGKGLGSRTSAVVAGIKIANSLGEMNLSLDDQIRLGSQIEGHSDGIASALLGDITVSYFDRSVSATVQTPIPTAINALVFTRNESIMNEVYNKDISWETAKLESSATNVLIASLMSNEWSKATEMMEQETIYRTDVNQVVPELSVIKHQAHEVGIYGTHLTKNGRLIITFGTTSELNELRNLLSNKQLPGSFQLLKINHNGATVRGE